MNRMAIIIVNYRTGQLTVDCLRSIAADGWLAEHGRVIVVDNTSGDDSVELLRRAVTDEGWHNWVDLIAAERNGGFAYGNNMGIRHALAALDKLQYVLLLNPDTVVRPGAIETLARFMDEHAKAGICGSRLLDAEGRRQCEQRDP